MGKLTEYLEKLKALEARATPGEWVSVPGDSWCAFPSVCIGERDERGLFHRHLVFEDHYDEECENRHDCPKSFPGRDENATFIAASRNAFPKLIEALEEAVGALEEIQTAHARNEREYDDGAAYSNYYRLRASQFRAEKTLSKLNTLIGEAK